MINTLKGFAEWLNDYRGNIEDDEVLEIIESNGWYDLTIEDCLDEECTLHSVCSDGKNMIIYNSETDKVSVILDNQKRENTVEQEIPHKEKVTDVNFKSVTGHDICIRIKRVSEPGYDVSFIEMSVDGGEFYKKLSSSTYDGQIYYQVYDKIQDKTLRVIIPDDVYCNIMYLRGENLFRHSGYFNDIILAKVKEHIKNGWVLPKAEIKRGANEQEIKNALFYWPRDESEMTTNEAFDYLQIPFARGLNGNYRGYMIAEYVDVI